MTIATEIPTKQQCLDAMYELREAYECALLGYWDNASDYHRRAIKRPLDIAVAALGYELRRLPQQPDIFRAAPKPKEIAETAP